MPANFAVLVDTVNLDRRFGGALKDVFDDAEAVADCLEQKSRLALRAKISANAVYEHNVAQVFNFRY